MCTSLGAEQECPHLIPGSCAGQNLLLDSFCIFLIYDEDLCSVFHIHSLSQGVLGPSLHRHIPAINRCLDGNKEATQSISESELGPLLVHVKSAKQEYMFRFCVIVFSLVGSESLWILQYGVRTHCHSSLMIFSFFTIVRNSQSK